MTTRPRTAAPADGVTTLHQTLQAAGPGPSVRRVIRSLALAATALVLAGCSGLPGGGDGDVGRVVRVVDGDTVHVQIGGVREKVRYIGVDTPEIRPTPECFGDAASAENARLVAGEEVRLESDAERRDRYGRLLAYVHRVRDGTFVNAALVRGGFAQPLAIPPNVRHAGALRRLARQARESGRGLWRACRTR